MKRKKIKVRSRVKSKKVSRSLGLISDKAARRKARREARRNKKIIAKEETRKAIKEIIKKPIKKIPLAPVLDKIPGKTQEEKCIACVGSGKNTKGHECWPCHGTGRKGGKKIPHEALCPDRKRLKCDKCKEVKEDMHLTQWGLLCLTCIRERKQEEGIMDSDQSTFGTVNSSKRKEKLGDKIGLKFFTEYEALEKKQKLAFISESSNLTLLREIIEHEKEHSKKRFKRAVRRIKLLTS